MGLDIYFQKIRHLNKGKDQQNIELSYFRKVNFLIPYFESILGTEIENCTHYPISKNDVLELMSECDEVLENHNLAEQLLPTSSGFFFGSSEYDKYYFQDVESVKYSMEQEVLPEFDNLDEHECITFYIWY